MKLQTLFSASLLMLCLAGRLIAQSGTTAIADVRVTEAGPGFALVEVHVAGNLGADNGSLTVTGAIIPGGTYNAALVDSRALPGPGNQPTILRATFPYMPSLSGTPDEVNLVVVVNGKSKEKKATYVCQNYNNALSHCGWKRDEN